MFIIHEIVNSVRTINSCRMNHLLVTKFQIHVTPDLGCKNTDKACVTTFLITSITNTLVIRYPPEFDYRPKYLTAANLRSSVVTSPGSDISSFIIIRKRLLKQVYNFSFFSRYLLLSSIPLLIKYKLSRSHDNCECARCEICCCVDRKN